jgi:hypothetical protein
MARLLGPAGPEVSCERCFELLDHYVDLELAGEDADGRSEDPRTPLTARRRPWHGDYFSAVNRIRAFPAATEEACQVARLQGATGRRDTAAANRSGSTDERIGAKLATFVVTCSQPVERKLR